LFDYRGEFRWLVFRSFWQGFSKRVMELLYPGTQANESAYLRELFIKHVPNRTHKAVAGPSLAQVKRILAILMFTGAVSMGYLYGLLRRDVLRENADDR
jgi:hypothetical protein